MSEAISKAVNPVTEQEREKKIAEIREALEKATPGPWNKEGNEVWRRGTGYNNTDGGHIWICDSFNNENAHLIANAPEWLGFLLDELERLEREYAEERAAHNAHVTELCELEKENRKLREEREKWEKEARLQYRLFNEYHDESREKIDQLRAERAKLIEGLRWYADEQNYDGSEFRLSETEKDMGQRARNILREIGVTVE